jgi:hypothetical protein
VRQHDDFTGKKAQCSHPTGSRSNR